MTEDNPSACNELIEDYLDDSLDAETRARVESHLAECEGCRNYLQQFRTTIAMLGRITEDRLDPQFAID